MRQCPECKRVYYDETLNFCLDDGVELLYGPAGDEPATAVLSEPRPVGVATGFTASEASTQTFEPEAQDAPAPTPSYSASTRNSMIAGIIGVLLVTALGFGSYMYYGRGASRQIQSIAVMPFVNESGNADVDYLSDGMTETLINSLTQVPDLNVKPRSSAFRYKGREADTKTIGSELGVGAILNGRLVQRGDDITLFLTLVDTASENQIWGKQYSRKLANLVTLQSDIVRDVSESLRRGPTGTDADGSRKSYSTNPEAYRLYLQGRYHWNKRSRRDMELAIDYFRQSAARDPQFALAFAGLADSLSLIGSYTGTAAHESIVEARSSAQTALSLDPRSAESHTALGMIFFYYDHDFREAEREFNRAIELDPKNGNAHHMHGLLFMSTGQVEQGLSEYHLALEREPVSLPINRGYALALTFARKYDESVAQFRKTIELEPSFGLAYLGLAYTLALQQKYAESAEAYARGVEVSGGAESARKLRSAFTAEGWSAFVRALLEPRSTPMPHFIRALYFVQLADKEVAFAELNRSFEDREGLITLLKVHPGLDPLRDDPRFKELVKKVGLPE
jgi:TolB-like protein/Tfp pilus assembly protein PilF